MSTWKVQKDIEANMLEVEIYRKDKSKTVSSEWRDKFVNYGTFIDVWLAKSNVWAASANIY